MNHTQAFLKHAVLNCAEVREAEAVTYAGGTPGFSLMQRAGKAVFNVIQEKFPAVGSVVVLCGPGNNGGDGFVVAEHLRQAGVDVTTATLTPVELLKGDAALVAGLWKGKTLNLAELSFDGFGLVVDGLFGTGLARPLEGEAEAAIKKLAQFPKLPVVAIDIPSGVNADTGQIMGCAPKADITVTFFRKKIGHVLLPGATCCGDVHVVDTGIEFNTLKNIAPSVAENYPDIWMEYLPEWRADQHKYDHGHVLVRGGAMMTGASRLASRAAQRMGAGLVSLSVPSTAYPIYAEALESVIVKSCDDLAEWRRTSRAAKSECAFNRPGAWC